MKFMWLFVLLSVSVSATTYSQSVKFTLSVKDVNLIDVFTNIRKSSEYTFIYNVDDVKNIHIKSIECNEATIYELLNMALQGSGFGYKIEDHVVIILPQENEKKNFLKIQGIVYDQNKEPLPGVTIRIVSTNVGTVTDAQGRFVMELPVLKGELEFSFIGYKKQRTVFTEKTDTLVINMEEETLNVDEVVVTGVVTKRKESFTGSSSTFTKEDIKSVGTTNIIASLKTLDPAFHVLENNEFGSDPNQLPNIEIRGKSSLISTRDELAEDPNQPLFILDGFESSLEAIYNLDMNRVSSITILKDAASTAIYGSKAANGVVVVETIKPEAGKLNLSYNGNANISWADLTSYNLMNAEEKLRFEKSVGRYDNFNTTEQEMALQKSYYDKLGDIARGVDTYWLSEPLRTGVNHNHSLYAQGGEGAFLFGLGLAYNGITGVMKESTRNNVSGNIDLTYRLGKLQFMNKFYINDLSSKNPIVAFSQYAQANPYYTKYSEDGEIEKWLEYNDYIQAANPLYDDKQNSYNKSGGFSLSDRFIVEYTPISSLKLRARFGLTHSNTNAEVFTSPKSSVYSNTEYTKRGAYNYSETKSNKYEGEFTLTYAQVLGDVHQFNVALGGYLSQMDTKSQGYVVVGFPVGDFTLPSFSNGYPEGGNPSYNESTNRSVSAYFIGNYAYDNRYLLDISYRVNGSSVFGVNKNYIGTWAIGLAWNLHNEKFISDHIEGISMLKIRASIGNPGNQNFSSSSTLTTFRYNFNSFNYFGMTTSLNQLGNPDLEWQTTLDRNIGFDITVLNNRLTLVGDYYYKTTDPLLIGISMPASSGATNNTIYKNFGKQISKGFNASATYYIFRKMDQRFWWSLRATIRTGNSELSGIGNRLDAYNKEFQQGELANRTTKRYYDGADPDDIWAVRSAGIDPATGREIFIDRNGEMTYDFSYDDEVIVGNSRPKAEGTIGTNFAWKGFSVNFDFRYKTGGKSFNNVLFNKVENISTGSLVYNQDKRALYDRWQGPGHEAQFKNIANSTSTPMSSRFVQNDNSFSLESLRVGYEFDADFARKLGVSSLRLNAYMNDIFRISSIKMERGISYPFARSISFALSVTL